MVGLKMLFRILPDKRQEFLQTYEWFANRQNKHSACTRCMTFEDVSKPNRFLWLETWSNAASPSENLATDYFKAFIGAIQVLGTLEEFYETELKQTVSSDLARLGKTGG